MKTENQGINEAVMERLLNELADGLHSAFCIQQLDIRRFLQGFLREFSRRVNQEATENE